MERGQRRVSDYASQVILWHRLFVGCGAAALILLVLAGLLFFALKIPRVFRSLTGRTRRKADRGEAGKTAALAGKDLPPEERKSMAGEEVPGRKELDEV